jgi:peroxiredoxin
MMSTAGNELPDALIDRLTGLPAPTVVLPWTAYGNDAGLKSVAAAMSLAQFAQHRTVVAYFTPGEDEGDGRTADTMSRTFHANYHSIGSVLGALTVGISAQTAQEQLRVAGAEEFSQTMLADNYLQLADELGLPTVEIAGRDEYQPLTFIIHECHIAHVIYPVASPSNHIDEVLRWLTEHTARKPYTRPRSTSKRRRR